MTAVFVNIDVDDIARAERFYCDAFGLTVGRRMGGDFLELLGAAVPIYLLLKKPSTAPFAQATTQRDFRRHWTPVHLDFSVPDIDAALVRAERAGARREGEVSEHAYGRLALMSDPFGHGFCLLQLTGRGYDEIVTP